MLKLLIAALLLLPTLAVGQTSMRCDQAPNLACATAADTITGPWTLNGTGPLIFEGLTVDAFETAFLFVDPSMANVILFPDASGTVCLDTGSGCGTGGGGAAPLLGVGTCTPLSGGVSPLFATASTCVDTPEANVEEKVKNATTFGNLQCITSGDPGSLESIVITGRSGACGALGDSGTFACTLSGGSGRATCNTGANSMALTAGQCWTIKMAPTTGIADVYVNCMLERTG